MALDGLVFKDLPLKVSRRGGGASVRARVWGSGVAASVRARVLGLEGWSGVAGLEAVFCCMCPGSGVVWVTRHSSSSNSSTVADSLSVL